MVVRVAYKVELQDVPAGYLAARVAEAIEPPHIWSDEIADGLLRSPTWGLLRGVMAHDDVFYGSSRMIELLCGEYDHEADHSFLGRWRPGRDRPFYATTLYHASVVTWTSNAFEARLNKARHFRQLIAGAERQLPTDGPGVIHIGVETVGGRATDALRHLRNHIEARTYIPENPRFRWVYGNDFAPELTTRRDETWAIDESMSPYKIGRHNTAWPLPDHLLVSPEDTFRPGLHF